MNVSVTKSIIYILKVLNFHILKAVIWFEHAICDLILKKSWFSSRMSPWQWRASRRRAIYWFTKATSRRIPNCLTLTAPASMFCYEVTLHVSDGFTTIVSHSLRLSILFRLTSSKQHQSHGDCQEDKRDLFCAILYTQLYELYSHSYQQFLMSYWGLRFPRLFLTGSVFVFAFVCLCILLWPVQLWAQKSQFDLNLDFTAPMISLEHVEIWFEHARFAIWFYL